MISLTRREVIGGAAAVALSGAAGPALAQAQAGVYRFKAGDIEVVSIPDGVRRTKLTATPTASTYTLTAAPQGAQAQDTSCGSLTLTQAGARGQSGAGTTCW